ncbi:ketoacyl-synt-domain-containing protein [Penicillium angulare]|uniref:ketoacyl-synt-domain-containing protein n=1 Tax=Penicillium angulare TaxID=116970 RepID=UPI0025416FD8|nr:ketoacyl-synt-domain-containing protein [Penicillium angulare]KAJ5287209.1 ketoacyl-synt-domain-containing protein [Penicillium angulare]
MAHSVNILHFGDQTVDISSSLRELMSLSKDTPSLDRLLRECTQRVVDSNIVSLTRERQSCSNRTLADLVDRLKVASEERPAVTTVLMCIYQLGCYLIYLEKCQRCPTLYSKTNILGLCTGMLPAATATCIDSTSELLDIAPEIVGVACRLGITVSRRSWALEATTGNWATSVSGITFEQLQDAIQEFDGTYCTDNHLIHCVWPTPVTTAV